MASWTKTCAPAIRTPSSTSFSVMSRRAAHWVQRVIRPARLDRLDQVRQRRRVRQFELGGPARQGEPGGLTGQPERDLDPAGHGNGGHRERLRTPLGGIGPRRHLDH